MAFSLHQNNLRCFKARKHVFDSDATKINRLINKTNLSNVEKHSDSCWLTSAAFVAWKTILDRDSALMLKDLGIGLGLGTAWTVLNLCPSLVVINNLRTFFARAIYTRVKQEYQPYCQPVSTLPVR